MREEGYVNVRLALDVDAMLDRNEVHKQIDALIARLARSYRYRDVEVIGGFVQRLHVGPYKAGDPYQ